MSSLLLVSVDASGSQALYRQIYDGLRQAILDGRLARGRRVPSSRLMSADLGVSRSTVIQAYDLLRAEGYIDGVRRGTTRVSPSIPDRSIRAERPGTIHGAPARCAISGASKRGQAIVRAAARFPSVSDRPARAFRTSVPAIDVFPFGIWGRLTARRLHWTTPASLAYGDPRGLPELREAIASYLAAARGVRCDADQVLITAGSQQAVDLACRALLDVGDRVWMEDPGYFGAAGAFVAAGARLVPVPVDAEGLDVASGIRRAAGARMAFVTPARQLPLGVTLSLRRRLALLEWARCQRSWILEDDYDSEFRYSTRPVSSLQGIDPHGCVIFTGTFSKVLLPGLRLGYVVVPAPLVETFTAVRRLMDFGPPILAQGVVADFMAEGHFDRHVRRMRGIYKARRALLVRLLRRHVGWWVDVDAPDAGMNLIAWLRRGVDDRAVSRALAQQGIDAVPLSGWSFGRKARPGLLLGFSGIREPELREGVLRLRKVLSARSRA